MMLTYLEGNVWLARGHARSANARIRTRTAWRELTTNLNSDGSGCIKTCEQWCKYWKDKKGAVKRKLSLIKVARRQTGGGNGNVPELTETELKILQIMGGESFASGDMHLQVDPFQDEHTIVLEQSPSILQVHATSSDQAAMQLEWSHIALLGTETGTPNEPLSQIPVPPCEVILEAHADFADAPRGNETPETPSLPNQPSQRPQTPSPVSRLRAYEPSPHGSTVRQHAVRPSPRVSAARRRLLRRSPPSQRRSEMASLTERFIAIEERRAEAELKNATAAAVTAQAISRLADGLLEYLKK